MPTALSGGHDPSFDSKETITMSNLDTSVRELPELELHPVLSALSPPSRNVSLADRLSLRLGLWLLLRSARQHARRSDRVTHATRLHLEREQARRDLRSQRERLRHLL